MDSFLDFGSLLNQLRGLFALLHMEILSQMYCLSQLAKSLQHFLFGLIVQLRVFLNTFAGQRILAFFWVWSIFAKNRENLIKNFHPANLKDFIGVKLLQIELVPKPEK